MKPPIPDKKPKTLLQSVGEHLAQRKLRSRERLKTHQRGEWNFAVVGLSLDTPNVSLEGLAEFRSVVEPPGEIELDGALEDRVRPANTMVPNHQLQGSY